LLQVRAPRELKRYLAGKGSICVDGVSLTVNRVEGDVFEVNLIPHTLQVTTLSRLSSGAKVNLEVDLIARYVHRQFEAMQGK
jgi:riboflavin synthase